jgi:hypothetical protein
LQHLIATKTQYFAGVVAGHRAALRVAEKALQAAPGDASAFDRLQPLLALVRGRQHLTQSDARAYIALLASFITHATLLAAPVATPPQQASVPSTPCTAPAAQRAGSPALAPAGPANASDVLRALRAALEPRAPARAVQTARSVARAVRQLASAAHDNQRLFAASSALAGALELLREPGLVEAADAVAGGAAMVGLANGALRGVDARFQTLAASSALRKCALAILVAPQTPCCLCRP